MNHNEINKYKNKNERNRRIAKIKKHVIKINRKINTTLVNSILQNLTFMLCTFPATADLQSLNVLMLSLGKILDGTLIGRGLDTSLVLSSAWVTWSRGLCRTCLDWGWRFLSWRRLPPSGRLVTGRSGTFQPPVPVVGLVIKELCKPRKGSVWGSGVVYDSWEGLHFDGLLQERYPHLAKSPSYSNGGNWGYGSLGKPPDPAPYDAGTLVQPVGVLIQSEPAIGAGLVVETLDLGAVLTDSLAGELMVLMALSNRSWFFRRRLPALAFQRQQMIMEPQMRHIHIHTKNIVISTQSRESFGYLMFQSSCLNFKQIFAAKFSVLKMLDCCLTCRFEIFASVLEKAHRWHTLIIRT